MILTIAIILAVLWLLGMVTAYTAGGLLHLLLIVAVIMIVLNIIQGRKAV